MAITEIKIDLEHNLDQNTVKVTNFNIEYKLDVVCLDQDGQAFNLQGALIPEDAINNIIDKVKENIRNITVRYGEELKVFIEN